MKNIVLSLFLLSLSCNSSKSLYKIDCLSIADEAYAKLEINNQHKSSKYTLEEASRDAIRAILYSGYTSTKCQTQKPILSQAIEIDNFRKIESNFFSKNGIWKTFIRTETNKKNGNGYIILVSKDALRQYLEKQNIIKSLSKIF